MKKKILVVIIVVLIINMMSFGSYAEIEHKITNYQASPTKLVPYDEIELSVNISNPSDISKCYVTYLKPQTKRTITIPLTHKYKSEIFETKYSVGYAPENGKYVAQAILVIDKTGNELNMSSSNTDLSALDFSVSGSKPDLVGPKITEFWVDKREIMPNEGVTAYVRMTDPAKIQEANITYKVPGSGRIMTLNFGSSAGGLCDASAIFGPNPEGGEYVAQSIVAIDGYGNKTTYRFTDADYRFVNFSVHGHAWDAGVITKEPTCTKSGTRKLSCTGCKATKTETVPATGHKTELQNKKEATCKENGNTGDEVCTICGKTVKRGTTIPKVSHKTEIRGIRNATCTDAGYTGDEVCTECKEIIVSGKAIPANGHKWDEGRITKDATETSKGIITYTCTVCGTTIFGDVETKNHDLEKVEYKDANCKKAGNLEYYKCKTCGKLYSDPLAEKEIKEPDTIIPITDHKWDEGKITKEATTKETGIRTYTCTVCGDIRKETIPKRNEERLSDESDEPREIENPSDNTEESNHIDTCPSIKFSDVELNLWYHDAVDYVLDKGYMYGVSETTFEPNTSVSRAMVVQVLYAMEGKPIPYKNVNFSDVITGKWYEDAINWAAANGIVAGYTDGRFGVNDPVKRQDLVAIMYKYAVYKGYDSKTNGDVSIFADRSSISAYAIDGMKWGVGHGIISGLVNGSKTYSEPKATATRAQLAVILKAFDENVS